MTEQPAFAFCTCLQLRQASRALTNMYDQMLAPSGLRATQFSLLASIKDKPTITQLGKKLLLEQSTVTRNIKLLQKQGYAELVPHVEDSRKKVIKLTPLGKKKVIQGLPLWQQAQARAVELMGEKPRRQFTRQLQGLMAQLSTGEE